jgi:hypothetical protein
MVLTCVERFRGTLVLPLCHSPSGRGKSVDGTWQGWLEFHPTDNTLPIRRTGAVLYPVSGEASGYSCHHSSNAGFGKKSVQFSDYESSASRSVFADRARHEVVHAAFRGAHAQQWAVVPSRSGQRRLSISNSSCSAEFIF